MYLAIRTTESASRRRTAALITRQAEATKFVGAYAIGQTLSILRPPTRALVEKVWIIVLISKL